MNKKILVVFVALLSVVVSCGLKDKIKDVANNETKKEDCKITVEMFNSFAGIKYGDKTADVKRVLGTPLVEETEDEYLRLEYENEDGIPLIFWCNLSTDKVETIRLECLGLNENLKTDISDAISEYKLGNCVGSLLGQTRKFVEDNLGYPASSGKEELSDYVDYYSKDNNMMLTFKFWKEQNNLMTQLNINWFFE